MFQAMEQARLRAGQSVSAILREFVVQGLRDRGVWPPNPATEDHAQ